MADSDDPTFNDDLLANRGDERNAIKFFKPVIHMLSHKELQDYFKKYNKDASQAKENSRRSGSFAIVLGACALLLAGVEIILHLYESHLQLQDKDMNKVLFGLSFAAAAAGIASLTIGGFGILYGRKKRDWLHNRFMGETIRQFHFQSFIARLPEILATLQGSDAEKKQAVETFKVNRNKWFAEFRDNFEGRVGARFNAVTSLHNNEGWWHTGREIPHIGEDRPELEPLFAAYRKLRIEHQRGYADYKLQGDYKIFSVMPRRQADVLEAVGTWAIGVLFFFHITVLIAIVIVSCVVGSGTGAVAFAANVSGLLAAVIISIPVVMLAVAAFENGLQPQREIDRYEKYRADMDRILRQFDDGKATQARKLIIMRNLEQVAFDEMRDFLRTHDKAAFVI